jgi:hypothetical protein
MTADAPKYNDDSSASAGEEPPKRNGMSKARQKRTREQAPQDVEDDEEGCVTVRVTRG